MARLTVYLPDEIEQRARALAKAGGVTVNKWILPDLGSGRKVPGSRVPGCGGRGSGV